MKGGNNYTNLKNKIINEMLKGSNEADREELLLKIIHDYPEFNNPIDREKMRKLYYKHKTTHNKDYKELGA